MNYSKILTRLSNSHFSCATTAASFFSSCGALLIIFAYKCDCHQLLQVRIIIIQNKNLNSVSLGGLVFAINIILMRNFGKKYYLAKN